MARLTDTEIRIAIAKECGWREMFRASGIPPGKLYVEVVPKYMHSIDFIRAAILSKGKEFSTKVYARMLDHSYRCGVDLIELTAMDWCQAFLEECNLWTN